MQVTSRLVHSSGTASNASTGGKNHSIPDREFRGIVLLAAIAVLSAGTSAVITAHSRFSSRWPSTATSGTEATASQAAPSAIAQSASPLKRHPVAFMLASSSR